MSDGPVYAELSWRLSATLIDVLVAGVFFTIAIIINGGIDRGLFLVMSALVWLAYVLIEGVRGGTPGKLALGLKVTEADGVTSPVGIGRAATRRVPDFVGFVPVFGQLLGIALFALAVVMIRRDTEQRRSPYDWISETRVVVGPRAF